MKTSRRGRQSSVPSKQQQQLPAHLRHPMAALLCPRDIVHDATGATTVNANPPPPKYHVGAHFPDSRHRPKLFADLVRLKNVVAFRDGTAAARASEMSRVTARDKHVDDLRFTQQLMKITKKAVEDFEQHPTTDRFYNRLTGARPEMLTERDRQRCEMKCCVGPFESDDRVIYRYLGEARLGLHLLEAIHFEIFLPDRLDLRYIQIVNVVVDKWSLKEGQLVWVSSRRLDCLPLRNRYRYRDVMDTVPYYVAWSVRNIEGRVNEDTDTWNMSFSLCATIVDSDQTQSQQSSYFAGVCGRFPFPLYGREALLDGRDPKKTHSVTVAKREACWIYAVEPVRALHFYLKIVECINSTNCQNGYRIDHFSEEKLEDTELLNHHSQWFQGKTLEPEPFRRCIERSLAFGTSMQRVDSREQAVFGEFSGYLHKIIPPQIVLYSSHESPPINQSYALITFYSNWSEQAYAIAVDNFKRNEQTCELLVTGRRSIALEDMSVASGRPGDLHQDLPCTVRFLDSPMNALDTFLRDDYDCISDNPLPTVISDLYNVVFPAVPTPYDPPRRNRRVLNSAKGREMAKLRSVRYSCAHPATSFAIIGDKDTDRTAVAVAIALASPKRHNKLLLATSRKDARSLFTTYLDMLNLEKKVKKVASLKASNGQPTGLPKGPTRFEDYQPVKNEDELREFLCWPSQDVVIATVDTILQLFHHHIRREDESDRVIHFINTVHTIIINNAETVTEAYFYGLVKKVIPFRVIFVGDHERADRLTEARAFHQQAAKPILQGIASYIRPHSMSILQLRRSPESEQKRAAYFVWASLAVSPFDGLIAYSEYSEAPKLREVLTFLTKCQVQASNVVVLTMSAKHTEIVRAACDELDEQPEITEFDEFEGRVRPVVVVLGGWYERRYWYDTKFIETYSTFYLDMLIVIGIGNFFKLRKWNEQEVKRTLVQRHVSVFPRKKPATAVSPCPSNHHH